MQKPMERAFNGNTLRRLSSRRKLNILIGTDETQLSVSITIISVWLHLLLSLALSGIQRHQYVKPKHAYRKRIGEMSLHIHRLTWIKQVRSKCWFVWKIVMVFHFLARPVVYKRKIDLQAHPKIVTRNRGEAG